VAKAGADVITISGHNGGYRLFAIDLHQEHRSSWEIGLREAHDTLVRAGLRSRLSLRVDGGLKFARDIVLAAILGADEFGFGMRRCGDWMCHGPQCHLNTCPVGIATQDEKLRARFQGKPEMVIAYFRSLAEEVRNRLAQLGVRSLSELPAGTIGSARDLEWNPLLIVPISSRIGLAPQQEPCLHVARWKIRFTTMLR